MAMKALLILALLTICGHGEAPPKQFEKLETTKGKVYENVTVRKVEPDGLSIMHESGTAKVAFEHLSDELKTAFGYDEGKAAEHREAQAEKDRHNELAMLAEEAAAASAKADRDYKNAGKELTESIKGTGVNAWLKIQQNSGGSYCLCRWGLVDKAPIKKVVGLSNRVVGYRPVDGDEYEEFIAVHGVGHLADGEKWRGTIYPCGKVTYESVGAGNRTVRRFATTPEEAQRLLLDRK